MKQRLKKDENPRLARLLKLGLMIVTMPTVMIPMPFWRLWGGRVRI